MPHDFNSLHENTSSDYTYIYIIKNKTYLYFAYITTFIQLHAVPNG